eukprot:2396298-Lingulodinium_polyedra.AAC.1
MISLQLSSEPQSEATRSQLSSWDTAGEAVLTSLWPPRPPGAPIAARAATRAQGKAALTKA